ncbi:uncharacterized protein [Physcomitrium patens]|uniref:Uncharacterized protein n=1 Tax=Physcomitrium patens TaxID=3218 RepID=A0A2K1JK53_PHYPA|nr:uncharacterized protein LOC112291497 [Physcomitrium patens]PNR41616.1 hypothetical protein PHYPA_019020 [Physcomitrium patens]|eukprot:XP_024394765.1 uncharacterized protein LOC112291497 [Physcomitrella patens]
MAMAEGNTSYLGLTAIITAVFQFSFFCVAATLKIDKVTDFAGVSNFVILAVTTFLLNGTHYFRQTVLTCLAVAWGLRLSIFLLLRILEWGEDRRMDNKRNNLARFAVFWTLQGIWVWTVSLPVTIVNGIVTRNPEIQVVDVLGWAMWGIGVTIEAIGDQQKLRFKRDLASQRRWCDVGVWKWSRHPNYFGEILLWCGVFVASTPVLKGGQWGAVASPILITLLLLFLSGIPLLEASADKKHGSNPEYRAYKHRTSPLIPLPPTLYGSLSKTLKTVFLFEFPLYNKTKPAASEESLLPES